MERMNNGDESMEKYMNFKEDGSSSVTSDNEEDPSLRPLLSCRDKLCKVFESRKFQISIVALVLLDTIIVIVELFFEQQHNEVIPHVLHYISVSILFLFMVEITLKVYAFGAEFFRSKMEVFDGFVVFLSFALDVIYFWHPLDAGGLFIIFRLWRIARIFNGAMMSVKIQSEHKLHKERQLKEGLEQELSKCRLYTNALEQEVEMLRSLLKKHDIKEIPPTIVNITLPHNTINVVAEVNEMQPV